MTESRPHFIFIGGFLGAGKTTAVAWLARHLGDQGLRVGVITNDQGGDLVDTALLRASGLRTAEITGGCFCCRFDALVGAAGRLVTGEPVDVFIAEAVGSCTDLTATVSAPLRRLHGNAYTVAPLSVLVDVWQARRILGLGDRSAFSTDVRYVYEKQLEEADVIILNKCDLLMSDSLDELATAIEARFRDATVLTMSARSGEGGDQWCHRVLYGEPGNRPTLAIDYDRYAGGESRLGWLNATAQFACDEAVDADAWVGKLVMDLQRRLRDHGAEIAHLKAAILPHDDSRGGDVAVVNVVRSDEIPVVGRRMMRRVNAFTVLINLRAEAAPLMLETIVRDVCGRHDMQITQLQSFRPGRPVPTHRDIATILPSIPFPSA